MGEETSSMFFRRCRVRKIQSTLLSLSDGNGSGRLLEDVDEIAAHIVQFYTDLLGSEVQVVEHSFP